MKTTKKLSLNDLTIESFVTTLKNDEKNTVGGGIDTDAIIIANKTKDQHSCNVNCRLQEFSELLGGGSCFIELSKAGVGVCSFAFC